MPQSLFRSTVLSLLFAEAIALEWLGPRATPTASLPDGTGFTPKPTKAPQYHVVANANPELRRFRRQLPSRGQNTCGYIDGNGAYSFTCSDAHGCGYNSIANGFGCCSGSTVSTDGYTYFTDCHASRSSTGCYASSEADRCTGICTVSVAICDFSDFPICRTVIQLGTASSDPAIYTLYDCIPLGGRTMITLQPSSFFYDPSVTPNPLVDPSYSWDGNTFVLLDDFTTSSTVNETITTPTTPITTPTTPIEEVETPTPPVEETPSDGPGGKKGSSTGAIAGGVVGGLAVVGIAVGAAIWSLMRRKDRARREAGAVHEVSHVTYVHDGK